MDEIKGGTTMTIEIFLTGLLAVSLFTTLGTQAVKKLLGDFKKKVGSNILSSIVSVVVSALLCVGYAIIMKVNVDAVYVTEGVVLTILGWLVAMCGYDKVKQAIAQILGKNKE